MSLININDLSIEFRDKTHKQKIVRVLEDINLEIQNGEIIAVVGESGCGKTTLGKSIAGIHMATSGKVTYKGENIKTLKGKDWKDYRLAIQLVHQDSYSALNPNKNIFQSLSLPLLQHKIVKNSKAAYDKLATHFEEVNLTPPVQFLEKYPHQLSGGQRQRILLARALSLSPKLIVADEPVSMVDVSLRISLLELMENVNKKYGISFVYITHDLGTARYIAKDGRILVMYLGTIVEMNNIIDAVNSPKHPYFKALLAAVPDSNPDKRENLISKLPLRDFDMPSILNKPGGCKFHTRCLYFTKQCQTEEPRLRELNGGYVACHNAENLQINK